MFNIIIYIYILLLLSFFIYIYIKLSNKFCIHIILYCIMYYNVLYMNLVIIYFGYYENMGNDPFLVIMNSICGRVTP